MQAVFLPDDRAFIRYLEVPGDEPTLLWLHGWQCSSTGELLGTAVQPPLRGRRSLLIDFLGHGYSDKPADFAYSLEAHARTVVAIIDALGIERCGLVGHSMGGGVAIRVAAARPDVVSLLVMAEGNLDAEGGEPIGGTEAAFVDHGFPELLEERSMAALADPAGVPGAHLGITALVEPRAIFREDVSMISETDPPIRSVLAGLAIPRWYLIGELSDPEGMEPGLAAIGVGWRVVPGAGHPMGLQNPAGFAQVVAEIVAEAWPAGGGA